MSAESGVISASAGHTVSAPEFLENDTEAGVIPAGAGHTVGAYESWEVGADQGCRVWGLVKRNMIGPLCISPTHQNLNLPASLALSLG